MTSSIVGSDVAAAMRGPVLAGARDKPMSGPEARQMIAAAVEHERRRRGMTAADLAREAGIDPATVRRLLAGGSVRLSSVRLVIAGLGLEWDHFIAHVADWPRPQIEVV